MKSKSDADALMLYDAFVEDLPVIQRREELPVEGVAPPIDETQTELCGQQVEAAAAEIHLSMEATETTITQVEVVVEEVSAPAEPAVQQQTELLTEEAPSPRAKEPKITQVGAMRHALLALGLGAKNADLADYLRSHFGLAPKNIAVLKSTVKKTLLKKDADEVQTVLPEPEPAGTTDGDSATTLLPAAASEPLSRGEEALIQPESAPPATVIEPQLVILQVESSEEPTTDLGPEEIAESVVFDIEDVAAVKGLCDRLGRDALLELIDLLSQ